MPLKLRRLRAKTSKALDWVEEYWLAEAHGKMFEAGIAAAIQAVSDLGDRALIQFTSTFDGWTPKSPEELHIDSEEIDAVASKLGKDEAAALEHAAERIRAFHERQKQDCYSYTDELGNRIERRSVPIQSVAVYVPGGTASYPSSCLMGALPAKIAGVPKILLATPCKPGELSPWVAYAAKHAGIKAGWRFGGAHAVAALAYGTDTVSNVDKIIGPGSAFVTDAKRQVAGQVGIDLLAGPSELLIIGDGSASPEWTAKDLLAQAEHGPDSRVALISVAPEEIELVEQSIKQLVAKSARAKHLERSLRLAALIHATTIEEARTLANTIAPEHLQLSLADARAQADEKEWICGSLFVGAQTAVPLGDYCLGPNHVLPTGRSARYGSGLSVGDFCRYYTVVEASEEGADKLGSIAEKIAEGEGLLGHAHSVRARMRSKRSGKASKAGKSHSKSSA